jgi:hypothetical protein
VPLRSVCPTPDLSRMVTKKRSTLPVEIQGPACVNGLVLHRCLGSEFQQRSMMVAIPWPTPMHMVQSA